MWRRGSEEFIVRVMIWSGAGVVWWLNVWAGKDLEIRLSFIIKGKWWIYLDLKRDPRRWVCSLHPLFGAHVFKHKTEILRIQMARGQNKNLSSWIRTKIDSTCFTCSHYCMSFVTYCTSFWVCVHDHCTVHSQFMRDGEFMGLFGNQKQLLLLASGFCFSWPVCVKK